MLVAGMMLVGMRASAFAQCPPTPRVGCVGAAAASVMVKEAAVGRERLKLAFKSVADATLRTQLGNPVDGTTRYDVCLFDDGNELVGQLTIDRANQSCGPAARPCWSELGPRGWRYKDVDAASDGVQKLIVQAGPPGRGRLLLKAGNTAGKQQMAMPTGFALRLEGTTLATAQVLVSDGACFGAALTRVFESSRTNFRALGTIALAAPTTTTTRPSTTSTTASPTTTRPSTTSTSTSTTRPSTTSTSTSTSRPTTTSTSTSTSRPTTTSTSTSTTRPSTTTGPSNTTLPSTTSSSTSTTVPTTSSTSTSTSRPTTTSTATSTTRPSTTSSTTSTSSSSTTTSTAPNQPPQANAGPDQATQTLVMLTFNGSSSNDPDGTITGWSWNFGDGGSAAGMSPTHAYATAGTYTATLTITDNKGATDIDTATVTVVNRPPVANAGPDRSATQGTAVAFNGSGSSDPDGTIVSYAWSFGDGGTASGVSPSHAYATPGTYTAHLTVTDNRNATSTDTAVVSVTPAGTSIWARRIGAAVSDSVEAVATDGSGNVVVAGTFRGSVDFGGTSLTSTGGADWFVAKYSPTGTLLWVNKMGGTAEDAAADVATAANGDVVVTGRFSGSASFGGTPLVANGPGDMALARYTGTNGAHQWSRRFGGIYDDNGAAIAIDPTGAIVLTGYFRGTIDFGLGPLRVPFDSDLDVFVAKFAADGSSLWAKNFVNTGNDRGYDIAVDGTGNIVVTGSFSNTIDFGGLEFLSPNALVDIFLCKLSSTGAHLWSRQIGSLTSNETAEAVAVDGTGNVFVAGHTVTAIDLGGGPLDPFGSSDGFVAKYSAATGAHLWSRRFGGTGNDYGTGLAVDGGGNVFVAGAFAGTASFGGPSLTAVGQDDAYVFKLSGNGAPTWARRLGGATSDVGVTVALTPSGYAVIGGYFYGSGTFSGIPLTSLGAADGFVATIAP